MKFLTAILAAVAAGVDPLKGDDTGFFDLSSTEGKVILGAIVVIVLLLVAWGIYAIIQPRDRHRRRRRHHHHDHDQHERSRSDEDEEEHSHAERSDAEADPADEDGHHRKKRRRRRREHRPRNPTLAETGGLPPIRTEAPPGP